jgi:hypothetical protein
MDNNNNENPGNGAQPGNIPPTQQQSPPVQQQNPPAAVAPTTIKKGNGFGIAALIVGIIAILGAWIPFLNFISLVFAIIALVLGAVGLLLGILKKRSKGLSIAGLALAVISIIVFAASYSVASSVLDAALDDEAVTEAIADAATDAIADAAAGADESSAESSGDQSTDSSEEASEYFKDNVLQLDDAKIEITEYKIVPAGTDGNVYGDKPVIVFYYTTTNQAETEQTATMVWSLCFEAIQDNSADVVNKLNTGVWHEDKYTDSYLTKIKPGGSIESVICYELDDDVTPVTLKATSGLLGSDLGEQEFEVK